MTDQDCPECGNLRIAIRTDVYKDGREFVYCDACGCSADRRVWNRIAPAIHTPGAEYESWRCISGGAADSWAATKPAATNESLCLECQGSACTAGEKCEAMSNPTPRRHKGAEMPQANGIPATLRHDEGAYAQCSYCRRYSLDPRTLSDRQPMCECGKKHGWCGSFKAPGPDARWSGATPPKEAEMTAHMRISYERAGRCFWHLQCTAQHHAPPMAIDRDDKDGKRTLLRCTACERAGWYPYGSVGEVSCEEQK